MMNLQIQETSFTPRNYEKPILNFAEILETMQITVKLRIHHSIMDRVLDYCAYEHFSPDGSEYYIVDFPFVENDFYYDILLSFGNKCECLEPAHIREKLKQKINEIAALYENEDTPHFPL